jgi:hypothetical protein
MCNILTYVIVNGGELIVDTWKFVIEKCICCLSNITFINFVHVSTYIFFVSVRARCGYHFFGYVLKVDDTAS